MVSSKPGFVLLARLKNFPAEREVLGFPLQSRLAFDRHDGVRGRVEARRVAGDRLRIVHELEVARLDRQDEGIGLPVRLFFRLGLAHGRQGHSRKQQDEK
jgi:hypothetical protein